MTSTKARTPTLPPLPPLLAGVDVDVGGGVEDPLALAVFLSLSLAAAVEVALLADGPLVEEPLLEEPLVEEGGAGLSPGAVGSAPRSVALASALLSGLLRRRER